MALILVVDDSSFQRGWIVRILKGEGFEILEAKNGLEGLEAIKNQKPDCVILDLLMPEMDGISLLKVLKEEEIKVPVIVLTSDIQKPIKEQCLGLGAVDFLNKPPEEAALNKAINQALNQDN